jgi:hypothetical protein
MNSSSDEEGEKKIVCCSNCGKKFSFHQGLYTHKKSGVCKKMVSDMINTTKYLETIKINIDKYKCVSSIEEILNMVFEENDYDRLPVRITDRRRKTIRILGDDEKYIKDHSHTRFSLFLSKIRMLLIKKIDMSGILKGKDDTIEFLGILTKDINVNKIIELIDIATC